MSVETPESGTITLPDGTDIPYRPIAPADQTALQLFHTRLSDRSIHQRFFGPRPLLSDEMAHYFTHLDGIDRFALISLDPAAPEAITAVVRFDREPGTDRAEYAAVVADQWQGHGLGLALTHRLIAAARHRGIRSLYALVLPENRRMLNLLRDLNLPEQIHHQDGVERIDVTLTDELSSP